MKNRGLIDIMSNNIGGKICFVLAILSIITFILSIAENKLTNLIIRENFLIFSVITGILGWILGLFSLISKENKKIFAIIGLLILIPVYPTMLLSLCVLSLYAGKILMSTKIFEGIKSKSAAGKLCVILAILSIVMFGIGKNLVIFSFLLGISTLFLGVLSLISKENKKIFAIIGLLILVPLYPSIILSLCTLSLYGLALSMDLFESLWKPKTFYQ